MRIFLDNSVPAGVRRHLRHHEVVTAVNRRWEELENGELLKVVEAAGFDAIVTADQNLEYQQNLRDGGRCDTDEQLYLRRGTVTAETGVSAAAQVLI